jgi:RNA polymerase sigma-70 factor, ECF subfamily
MALQTETIWADFSRPLLGFIKQRVADTDVAQDILQDVFIKIHLNLPTLADTNKLAAWVYQITRHTILDHLRNRKKTVTLTEESAVLYLTDPPLTETFSQCLRPFVNRLAEPYQDVLLQTELGSLSLKDYARLSGLSYSGAKSRSQRARAQLRRLFTDCCRITPDVYGHIVDYQNRTGCSC